MEFHIAHHTGDDNDNSISRFTMEAESKDALFAKLEKEFFENFKGNKNDVIVDGDENSLTLMWFESFDEDGKTINSDDVEEDDNSIPFHSDYYIETE